MAAVQPAVYTYFFTHVPDSWSSNPFLGVGHYAEVQFVFHDNATLTGGLAEQLLATEFNNYWTTFAATGNPNYADRLIDWPAYSYTSSVLSGRQYLQLDLQLITGSNLKSAECDAWDQADEFLPPFFQSNYGRRSGYTLLELPWSRSLFV